jgi:hypothetical protein
LISRVEEKNWRNFAPPDVRVRRVNFLSFYEEVGSFKANIEFLLDGALGELERLEGDVKTSTGDGILTSLAFSRSVRMGLM